MREIELFLTLLANKVYSARVNGTRLNDATDFKAWLEACAVHAGHCASPDEFFAKLP